MDGSGLDGRGTGGGGGPDGGEERIEVQREREGEGAVELATFWDEGGKLGRCFTLMSNLDGTNRLPWVEGRGRADLDLLSQAVIPLWSLHRT